MSSHDNNSRPMDRRRKPPYFFYGIIILIGFIMINKAIYTLNDSINNKVNTYLSKGDLVEIRDEIRELKEYNKVLVSSLSVYNKNEKAFNLNTESQACMKCHLQTNMYLLKSTLSYTDFKDYVRGTKRHVNNTEMPSFDDKDISDRTLENMYLILKQ